MNKSDILSKLLHKRVKDYGFTIVFFFIFSFFLVFAIRPNLLAVVTLQEQLDQLGSLNQRYEDEITKIVHLQSLIEENRDNFPLLEDSLPSTPQVNKVIDDISRNASDSGLIISKIEVHDISLKEDKQKNKIKSFAVNIETNTDFEHANRFIDTLFNQRRLKSIKDLSMIKEEIGTESSVLKMQLQIDALYL